MKRHLLLPLLLLAKAAAGISAVPHPAAKFSAGDTVLWTPMFQATWDKALSPYGVPKKIEPANPLIADLNSFKWSPSKTMPEGSWKTWTGPATFAFVNEVNAEASKMTGESKGPFAIDHEASGSAAFGFLKRDVTFRRELQPCLSAPLLFQTGGSRTPVRYFGMRNEAEWKEMRVISFNGPARSHAIQLMCHGADDTVILYLPPNPQDFSTACRWIRTWATEKTQVDQTDSWNSSSLHEGDEVRIPYLDLDAVANFGGQLDSWMHFKGTAPHKVVYALQKTAFSLHERGASVRSETTMFIRPFAGEPSKPLPRKFIYDRPFFVFLWREGAEWPYFGAWIGDTAGMTPFDK